MGARHLLVLDGASPLTQLRLTSEGSDARWFAQRVRRGLVRLLQEEKSRDRPLEALIRQAAEPAARRYHLLSGGPLPDAEQPSAGLALFRQRGDQIDFYGLGDCTGLVRYGDGRVEVLRDESLSRLDGEAIQAMCAAAEQKGISIQQARRSINDILIQNRGLKNRAGGYYVLDMTGRWVGHGISRSFSAPAVESLAVLTDGFAQLCEFSILSDYAQLHEKLLRGEMNALFRMLFDALDADPDYSQYPRFKLRDDTTAAVVRVLPG